MENETIQANQTQYKEAWVNATEVESVQQAEIVFDAIGVPLALLIFIPFLFMLTAAGFLKEWDRKEYWLVYGLGVFTAGIMLIAFPFLLMYL